MGWIFDVAFESLDFVAEEREAEAHGLAHDGGVRLSPEFGKLTNLFVKVVIECNRRGPI